MSGQDRPRPLTSPRLARWLLVALLPARRREFVVGDLEEGFRLVAETPAGLPGARRWYRRQVARSLLRTRPPRPARGERRRKGAGTMDRLAQDIRGALRMLRRSPGFTLAATLTLALGIGANTALFSVLDAVLLRRLPVPAPERLALMGVQHPQGIDTSFNFPLYRDYSEQNSVFDGLAAFSLTAVNLTAGNDSQRIRGLEVSANYFDVLRVTPVQGRGFLPEEERAPGVAPVAILGHSLWRSRFHSDPRVVGETIRLNGHPFTVVGVAPPGFGGTMRGIDAQVYVPIAMDRVISPDHPREPMSERGFTWLSVIGRLADGVDRAAAQTAMRALAGRIRQVEPMNTYEEIVLSDGSLGFDAYVSDLAEPLRTLQIVAGLVLLIACANLASLLLARSADRRREVGVRVALGAGRGALVRQFLTESLLLALLGGAAGAGLAPWLVGVLTAYRPRLDLGAAVDGRALLFALGLAVATGLLFGLAPVVQAMRSSALAAIKDAPVAGRLGRWTLRRTLVVGQLALSLAVLVAAGLCVESLRRLHATEAGYDPARVLVMSLDLSRSGYDPPRAARLQADLVERVAALPGVEATALGEIPPLLGLLPRITSVPEGQTQDPDKPINIHFTSITPNFFRTLGMPLLQGRDFTAADDAGAERVLIVNETLARKYWPEENAVGRTIALPPPAGETYVATRIVGVVADSLYHSLSEPTLPVMFFPLAQDPAPSFVLFTRAARPASLIEPIRAAVRALDPALPVFSVRTLAEQKSLSLLTPRMVATLLGLLGGLGLLLGALGLYAILAYLVAQRTREFGIRMALGADRGRILRLVLRDGMQLVALGLLLGLAASVATARLLRGLLFGVGAGDPVTLAAVVALLVAVAMVACLLPARRATRVDPNVALRCE